MKLIASNQLTLTNLLERAIDRTEVTFWHGLSATKHPLGVYDCGGRDHTFGNEFSVTSGKTYTVRVIAKQTKGSLKFAGGIWYTAMTSGNAWDGYAPFTLVGETSEDGLGIYERKFVVASGKTKAKIYIQLEQWAQNGYSTAWRIYDGQVFDENGQPLITDQNNLGALTSPMAAPNGTYIWKRTITYYTDGTNNTVWEYSGVGPKGSDGNTPYIHWAYSDNADGTGLTTSDNGQRYIGNYSDYTQADSTDKTKYKWADRWAKIKIDGRNLAQKTSKDWSNPYTSFSGVQNTCINLYKVLVDGLSVGDTLKSRIVLKYTSIIPASGKTATIWLQGNGDVTDWNAGAYKSSPAKPISGSGEMVFEHEFKITADHLKNNNWNWQFRTDYIASGSLQWRLAKVENGTVFTGWSPALEDTQEQIDSKADQTLTQDQLNALAEKNNLIKAEMEAKATIDTVNQWITAYQNYVNANDADKARSEQALKDASERILAIRYEVDNLKVVWDAIDTYMSFQNEGLVIGKKDGSAYAKFSDDRISLFSGNSEVMYISQGTLNIANGIFTKTIQIGRFRFETHPADADMLVVRFVGG